MFHTIPFSIMLIIIVYFIPQRNILGGGGILWFGYHYVLPTDTSSFSLFHINLSDLFHI